MFCLVWVVVWGGQHHRHSSLSADVIHGDYVSANIGIGTVIDTMNVITITVQRTYLETYRKV